MTVIIGITGGIASGKSTAARMMKRPGIVVFNADDCVHELFVTDFSLIAEIAEVFPEVCVEQRIDRAALSRRIASDSAALTKLEQCVHPRVREKEIAAINHAQRNGLDALVLDIPLLFETGADSLCDRVIAVDVSAKIQHTRAMKRRGMNEEKLKKLLARQCKPFLRNSLSDMVITSNLGRAHMRRQIENIVKGIIHHA